MLNYCMKSIASKLLFANASIYLIAQFPLGMLIQKHLTLQFHRNCDLRALMALKMKEVRDYASFVSFYENRDTTVIANKQKIRKSSISFCGEDP